MKDIFVLIGFVILAFSITGCNGVDKKELNDLIIEKQTSTFTFKGAEE